MKLNKEAIKRTLKYILQWFIIFIAAKCVPSKQLDIRDVTMIAIIGSVSLALLDLFFPTISQKAKDQIVFSIGLRTLIA